MTATPESMSICGSCGVIAPAGASQCDSCKSAIDATTTKIAPPRADGRYWMQVRAQFKCKHCEKRSPVNHVDVDGTFTCLRCQRDQGADAGIWAIGLRFCHEVGDLAGPSPEGRNPNPEVAIADRNQWADIGVTRTRARLDFSETRINREGVKLRSLFLDARPGAPLCTTCSSPLDVAVERPGHLKASCPTCGDAGAFSVDPKAHNMHKPFMGALSDDHRTDKQEVKMTAATPSAAIAIECPGCGAALDIAAKDHFVTCKFCSVPSKIPSRIRSQMFTEGVELEPFWLLFEGPSKARDKLVKKAIAERNRQAKQLQKQQNRQQSAGGQLIQGGSPRNLKSGSTKSGSSKSHRNESRAAFAIVLAATLFAIGVTVYLMQSL